MPKHRNHHGTKHKQSVKPVAAKVKVAVRARPLSKQEQLHDGSLCVEMQGTQTIVNHNKLEQQKVFNFDHSFWSTSPDDPQFANQAVVFDHLGQDVLKSAFEGYNACIFAYGQTGSGKTYTMMGPSNMTDDSQERGIIPRLCDAIFGHVNSNTEPHIKYKIDVSFMEIYNEKVQDLLKPSATCNLRLREHKILGPYVEGLSKLAVNSFTHIRSLMEQGNKLRHTAETQMNRESSRSHAVFTITVTEARYFAATKATGEKTSRISLVDLAGSERHGKTGTSGIRLVEGSNINKSLTTLGLVISALADSSVSGKAKFIPYRDSTLTYLLKDNLGGNSRTVMVATISPSYYNIEESLSTLRYADRAKRIVNHAVVNEDPNARVIRELQEELERLRSEVGQFSKSDSEELLTTKAKLQETEALIEELNVSWEEKLKTTEKILEERKKEGITRIGRDLSSRDDPDEELEEGTDCDDEIPPQDIYICGPGTEPEHAIIEFTVEHNTELNSLVEIVVLHPIADECFVDGDRLEDSVTLCQGNVVQLGQTNIFRFNHPTEAARMRKERNQSREPMSFKTASKLVSMFAVSSLNVSGTSSQLSMLESNANSTNNETSVENLAIVEDQEIELQRMRETEAEEELKRKQEFLENERAMLQAEKERMAKEREQLVNQQRLHEEQLRHAAEKREKELEEEMRLRAEREAREEIERQMQETERLRQKISEMQLQLQLHASQKEEELAKQIELERQRLLAESKASLQEIEQRAREDAARALEEEKRRKDEELAKARLEIEQLSEKHKEAVAKRRQEAEDRLVRATKEITEKNELVQQLQQQLYAMHEKYEADAAASEQQLREELSEKVQQHEEQLRQAREHEEQLLAEITAREACLREEMERKKVADSEVAQRMQRLQQESLDREAASREEAQQKMNELALHLERERAEFEQERRRRQAAEAQAAREKLERDLEEAYSLKMLEEERQEAKKKYKRNMKAKEAWMKRFQQQSSVEKQLQEQTALLHAATQRRNEAYKDIAKANMQMEVNRRQSSYVTETRNDSSSTPSISTSACVPVHNRPDTDSSSQRPDSSNETVSSLIDQSSANEEINANTKVGKMVASLSSGEDTSDADDDIIDIMTPTPTITGGPCVWTNIKSNVESENLSTQTRETARSPSNPSTLRTSDKKMPSNDNASGATTPLANNPFLEPYVRRYGSHKKGPSPGLEKGSLTTAGVESHGRTAQRTAPVSTKTTLPLNSPKTKGCSSESNLSEEVVAFTNVTNNPFLDPSLSPFQEKKKYPKPVSAISESPIPPPRLNSVGALDMGKIRAQVEAKSKDQAANLAKQRRQLHDRQQKNYQEQEARKLEPQLLSDQHNTPQSITHPGNESNGIYNTSARAGAATSSREVTMAHAFMKIMKAQEEWTKAKERQHRRAEREKNSFQYSISKRKSAKSRGTS